MSGDQSDRTEGDRIDSVGDFLGGRARSGAAKEGTAEIREGEDREGFEGEDADIGVGDEEDGGSVGDAVEDGGRTSACDQDEGS